MVEQKAKELSALENKVLLALRRNAGALCTVAETKGEMAFSEFREGLRGLKDAGAIQLLNHPDKMLGDHYLHYIVA